MGFIGEIQDDRLEDLWKVNCLHPIYLLQAMANKLLERDQRCGVIFTSSVAAHIVAPSAASYAASKSAISCFGEAMHFELIWVEITSLHFGDCCPPYESNYPAPHPPCSS